MTGSLAPHNARRVGFAAGVWAALLFLVAVAVLRLVTSIISLPEVVADGLLLLVPGAAFSALLEALQRAAKPLLYLAVGVGIVLVGGLLGRWYAARPGWRQAGSIVLGTWLVFGLGVYTVVGAGPFGARLQAGALWHGASLLGLVAVYGLALRELFGVLERRALGLLAARGLASASPAPDTSAVDDTRRALVRTAGVALLGTVAAGAVWRLATRAPAAEPAAQAANPPPFDLPGLSPEITPVADFYTVSKNFVDPAVQASGWRLRIDGLVDRPLELTYDELRALPASEGFYTLMCISNEVGGDLMGNAWWRGVKLRALLEQAGVRPGGYKAVLSAADDYKDSVRLERALHPDTLLAWEMNGEPLTKAHGFPARLLIPGIYGMKNVKWLTGVSIVREDFKGYWQTRGWDDDAPYQTASRIDVPRPRATLGAGAAEAAGVAFAGDRGIQKVEVSTDGGRAWQEAQLKPGLSPYTWQLWRAPIEVERGVRDVRVRATDGTGRPQVRDTAPPFPAGSTGYHVVDVAVG